MPKLSTNVNHLEVTVHKQNNNKIIEIRGSIRKKTYAVIMANSTTTKRGRNCNRKTTIRKKQ